MLSVTWEGEVFERDGYIPTAPRHFQVSLILYLKDWPSLWESRSAWLYHKIHAMAHTHLQLPETSGVPRGWGLAGSNPPSEIPKALQNRAKFNPIVKTVKNLRRQHPKIFGKKGSKNLKLPPVRNCFTLAMTNKLVVIVNNLKVPKIKNILLYEMKFLVRNYSYLQNA